MARRPSATTDGPRVAGGRERGLTPKQQLFVEAYLGVSHGNVTDAARRAGYAGNAKTLHAIGAENLEKPGIRELVADRLKAAKKAMEADEVLGLLSDHARGTMDDFVDIIEVESVVAPKPDPARCDEVESPADEYKDLLTMRRSYPVINLAKAKARGKLHLVKKISFNQFGPVLELYGAQSALELLGRHHRLFEKDAADALSALAQLLGVDPERLPPPSMKSPPKAPAYDA
jgi:phage terminase small subunit